jgi:ABC-2 type transport system permease protein
MNPRLSAIRIGLRRGWTELRHMLGAPGEVALDLVVACVILVVLYFLRDDAVEGTSLSLAAVVLPGVVGMATFSATILAAFTVAAEREDGTLLRARAAPFGIVSYVTGQVVRTPLYTILYILLILVPGLLIVDGLAGAGIGSWATLAGLAVLGLLAAVPLGMALGSVASNPRAVAGNMFLVSGVLIAISGIFYPITALPGWLHPIAQVFPYYWLGLGMRSALLPDAAVTLELAGSWRHLETVIVLGTWAVIGLVLAPPLLRRMARRVSGATVEAGRQKATQRVG